MNQTDIQKSFWRGTFIVSGAAILVKVLSAFYRIPYQNIAGDLGLYVYQQVYPFYAIAFALSLYGFPLMLSKLLSEHTGDNDIKDILSNSFTGLSLFFVGLFVTLYSISPVISGFMHDPMLTKPLQVASFAFLFVPILSVTRGYFQAEGEMVPTAVSQVLEQFVRVSMIILLTVWLVSQGSDHYSVGSGAIFGGLVGSLVSVVVLLLYVRNLEGGTPFNINSLKTSRMIPTLWVLLKGGFAICVTTVMLALFQLIDAFQVVPALLESGAGLREAIVSKGIFDRGQPLLQLGTVIATAMALPLIPFIAKAKQNHDNAQIKTFTGVSLKFSFIFGGAAAVGLSVIIVPTNVFLYQDADGSFALGLLSAAILFGSLAITSSAVLQGLGKIGYPVLFIFVALIVKGLLNSVLIPMFGIAGSALSTVIGTAIVTILNMIMIDRLTDVFKSQRFYSWKVITALVLMAIATSLWKELWMVLYTLEGRTYAGFVALSSVMVGGIVFVKALLYQNVWKKEEIAMLPKGQALLRLLYKERIGGNG
ncbi:polysaccharide biosynthesis protein [Alkalihalobacillus sp. AL-G]|uniref:putative polysaccharide biosynthesis protein n=1 Tax=Alkalihalobacillus sp. AL-G TaxID=2926399 RepID=UPI00272CB12B|nr:polysaccharide biosynthesis protein [Alkalihalobacillus sp. AL-G]WLD93467.1 polysaccharide biosynthesis protein [Alkalihalobacillus sp. AL-G]